LRMGVRADLITTPPGAVTSSTAQWNEIQVVVLSHHVLIEEMVERATCSELSTRTRCGAVSPCADRPWGAGALRGPCTWHPSLTVDCRSTLDVPPPRPASRPRTCGPPGWISVRRRMPTAPSGDRSPRSGGHPRHRVPVADRHVSDGTDGMPL